MSISKSKIIVLAGGGVGIIVAALIVVLNSVSENRKILSENKKIVSEYQKIVKEKDTKAQEEFLSRIKDEKPYEILIEFENFCKSGNAENMFKREVEEIVVKKVNEGLSKMLGKSSNFMKKENYIYLQHLCQKITQMAIFDKEDKAHKFSVRYLKWWKEILDNNGYQITIEDEIKVGHRHGNRKLVYYVKGCAVVDEAVESRHKVNPEQLPKSTSGYFSSGWETISLDEKHHCMPWQYLHLRFYLYKDGNSYDTMYILKICPSEDKKGIWYNGKVLPVSDTEYAIPGRILQFKMTFSVSGPDTFETLLQEYHQK